MIGSRRIAVVVPARDEERFLPGVLAGIPLWIDDVVVVDDGSADRTGAVVAAWPDERLRLLTHRPGRGVGAAILAGYEASLGAGADAVAVVGADGQMDLEELESVLSPVLAGEADYVQGSRFPDGRLHGRMPLARRLGNRLLTHLTAWAARARVSDSQCGYTAASRDFLRGALRMPLPAGYGFPAFVRVHAHAQGWRVVERPVSAIYGDEVSGIRLWRDPARIVWRLVRLGLSLRFGDAALATARRPTLRRAT